MATEAELKVAIDAVHDVVWERGMPDDQEQQAILAIEGRLDILHNRVDELLALLPQTRSLLSQTRSQLASAKVLIPPPWEPDKVMEVDTALVARLDELVSTLAAAEQSLVAEAQTKPAELETEYLLLENIWLPIFERGIGTAQEDAESKALKQEHWKIRHPVADPLPTMLTPEEIRWQFLHKLSRTGTDLTLTEMNEYIRLGRGII